MTAKEIERSLNNSLFRLRTDAFIHKEWPKFNHAIEKKDFLTFFLVYECIGGVIHYFDEELLTIYEEVRKMVEQNKIIFSEDLPVHKKKRHANKLLSNVYYIQEEKSCIYEEKKVDV